jgi:hypothetical protein
MEGAIIAFVMVTGFTSPNASTSFVVISALYDEAECHRVALELGAAKHKCIEYRLAVPQVDASANAVGMADAIADLEQDGIIR